MPMSIPFFLSSSFSFINLLGHESEHGPEFIVTAFWVGKRLILVNCMYHGGRASQEAVGTWYVSSRRGY